MNRISIWLLVTASCFGEAANANACQKNAATRFVKWKDCLSQKREWYGSTEAVRIADNVLLYQRDWGGWPKNIDMASALTEREKAVLNRERRQTDSTIDNEATYTQMAYLARVFNTTKQERFREAFIKGLDYLIGAQYDNGGWPQFYPA